MMKEGILWYTLIWKSYPSFHMESLDDGQIQKELTSVKRPEGGLESTEGPDAAMNSSTSRYYCTDKHLPHIFDMMIGKGHHFETTLHRNERIFLAGGQLQCLRPGTQRCKSTPSTWRLLASSRPRSTCPCCWTSQFTTPTERALNTLTASPGCFTTATRSGKLVFLQAISSPRPAIISTCC